MPTFALSQKALPMRLVSLVSLPVLVSAVIFENFDCIELPVDSVVDWTAVHVQLVEAASAESVVFDVRLLDEVFGKNFEIYANRCPLGVLSLSLLQAFRLRSSGQERDGQRLIDWVRRNFEIWPWYTVAQSRWPFFELLVNYLDTTPLATEAVRKTYAPCSILDTDRVGIMDWKDVQSAGLEFVAESGAKMETAEHIGNLSNELFAKGNIVIDRAMDECMCGVVFLAAVQSLSAAARLSQYFPNWGKIIDDFIKHVPFEVYVGGKWRITEILVMFADLNKGDKYISYSASGDKLRRRYSDLSPTVASALLPFGPSDSLRLLPSLALHDFDLHELFHSHPNEFLRVAATTIQAAAVRTPSGRKLVMYAMVYGSKWTPLIKNTIDRFAGLGISRLLFVTLGDEGKRACAKLSEDAVDRIKVFCLEFPSLHNSQIHRYTAAHLIVYLGFDVFYFDLDTFFFKNPIPALMAALESHGLPINEKSAEAGGRPSLLISSHVDANCVNVGFFYIKAEMASAEFFTLFIDWYHRHGYEIDQRGMDAFLGHSKTIGASYIPARIRGAGENELVMHYAILDDVNAFVIPGVGWSGNFSDVVVAHYCEWDFDRKMVDLNFLYNQTDSASISQFFDQYRLSAPPVRLECW